MEGQVDERWKEVQEKEVRLSVVSCKACARGKGTDQRATLSIPSENTVANAAKDS